VSKEKKKTGFVQNSLTHERQRRKLVYTVLFVIILATAVFVITTPRPSDQFFQFYVLGNSGYAGNYFPNGSLGNMTPGVQDNWTLVVANRFQSVQLVELLVKLGNQTTSSPSNSTPANLPIVASFFVVLAVNQTFRFPFHWEISGLKVDSSDDYDFSLIINNETYASQVTARGGLNFRYIFEIWSATAPETTSLHFGWSDNGQTESAWLQTYFNVTSVS
jgi:hypothetical protein